MRNRSKCNHTKEKEKQIEGLQRMVSALDQKLDQEQETNNKLEFELTASRKRVSSLEEQQVSASSSRARTSYEEEEEE